MEKAHEVLHDAEFALELLEQCENNRRQFRILIVACMTLLKTVGQVLVNKNADSSIKRITQEYFHELKINRDKNKIFFEFVERERNLIIHEYSANLEENDIEIVYMDGNEAKAFNLGDLYHCLADDEVFDGQDVRDLIGEAIEWWKVQLKNIEEKLTQY